MAVVLVVDDERDLCELIRVNLSLDAHDVLIANDGGRALELLRARPVELVLLDVMMPGRDGFSVLEAIKTSCGEISAIPVVMLTARSEVMDRLRGGIEGAVRYLTKPFSVLSLRQTVLEVLEVGSEPRWRRQVQQESLMELARLETGGPGPGSSRPGVAGVPHPRLTRYEPLGVAPASPPRAAPALPVDAGKLGLSTRQSQILEVVLAASSLGVAAEQLAISRSYLYACLRRIARKAGAASGPDLVRQIRMERAGLASRG